MKAKRGLKTGKKMHKQDPVEPKRKTGATGRERGREKRQRQREEKKGERTNTRDPQRKGDTRRKEKMNTGMTTDHRSHQWDRQRWKEQGASTGAHVA